MHNFSFYNSHILKKKGKTVKLVLIIYFAGFHKFYNWKSRFTSPTCPNLLKCFPITALGTKTLFLFDVFIYSDKTDSYFLKSLFDFEAKAYVAKPHLFKLSKFTNSCIYSVLLIPSLRRYYINWKSTLSL